MRLNKENFFLRVDLHYNMVGGMCDFVFFRRLEKRF
jgi:hypothetical protein